nr:hypothetical protein [Tanacetum cinerariifolium]
ARWGAVSAPSRHFAPANAARPDGFARPASGPALRGGRNPGARKRAARARPRSLSARFGARVPGRVGGAGGAGAAGVRCIAAQVLSWCWQRLRYFFEDNPSRRSCVSASFLVV